MKFGLRFVIKNILILDCGFRARKQPRKFGEKDGLIQKQIKFGKNISRFMS